MEWPKGQVKVEIRKKKRVCERKKEEGRGMKMGRKTEWNGMKMAQLESAKTNWEFTVLNLK